ncbi:tetratricopeptide repeat protein [Nitrospirillum pindoramense]|uniref:Tetratricopeptide repeat protein n=1 Tax=Nitrospirillum amazonense TaxID=28077 RepID=A0A560H2E5_9PROT|nr:tetratricopeptide repeat protein [Nitrospirillum amazonense]TWB40482.1 tetratricopeptide repeat protein [Nitrospirillum amazonense]
MVRVQELLEQAAAARRAGRLPEAIDLASQAVTLSRASGQEGGADLRQALTRLAQASRDLGRYDDARCAQEEAVALLRADGGLPLAGALRHLGGILDDQGAHAEAAPVYAEMMVLYQAADTAPLEMANAVRALACNAEGRGNQGEAAVRWQEALDRYAVLDQLFQRDYGLPDNPGVAEARTRLARLHATPP